MTLRADAQRNLDRLLDVAEACFGERGLDCSIDEIARRAGVGHGTVFRRFATKDELVSAVLGRHLAQLTAIATESASEPDPWDGFERFLRAAGEVYAANLALIAGFQRSVGSLEKGELMTAVTGLVLRAQRAGVLRRDVSAEDVMMLIPAAAGYPDVVLDGLRAR
jgi:AcrR family transcriptional regulator